MRRRELIESGALTPAQATEERLAEVELCHVPKTSQADDARREPLVDAFGKGGVAHVRPCRVDAMQECQSFSQAARGIAPGERVQTGRQQAIRECACDVRRIEIA